MPALAPLPAWEPVVYAGERRDMSLAARHDALVCNVKARTTDPGHVIGAKPAAFCFWLFDLLGALPGDDLSDLFPGSGGIGRAWSIYVSRATDDMSTPAERDVSRVDEGDASRSAARAG